MIHAARALDLQVMLGCMIESELGIAQAAQLGSLADHIDLDGHLLISSRPFTGLGLSTGGWCSPTGPGWAWSRPVADRLALFTGGGSRTPTPRPRTGSCATGSARWSRSSTPRRPAGRLATSCPTRGATVPIVALGRRGRRAGRERAGDRRGAVRRRADRRVARGAAGGDRRRAGRRGRAAHRARRGPGAVGRGGRRAGVELRDLRAAPPGLSVPAGPASGPDVRVVHTVGSDCAIGKMSVTLELDAAARARGSSRRSWPPGRPGSRSPAGGSRSTT